MKVAIASSGLGHIYRGIESWARELAYALNKKGVDVTLFKGGGDRESEIEEILPCIKRDSRLVGWNKSIIPGFYRYLLEQITFSIPLSLRLKNYDIVHLADAGVASLLMRVKKLGLLKTKVIFATSLEIKDIKNPPRWPLAFEHLHLFAPHYLEKAKKAGFNTNKWFMIPHFVDTKKFTPTNAWSIRESLGIPEDAFVVLSVGAIQTRIKRMDYVIEEVAELEDAYLIIAGHVEQETEKVIKMGKKMLGDRIFFMKNVPMKEIPRVYGSSDVFVLGSLTEQFGIAILEAMASGIPVIVQKTPITTWIVDEGGTLIDMSKQGNLTSALRKYLNDNFRHRMGKKARERAEERFSKENVLKNIINMYEVVSET